MRRIRTKESYWGEGSKIRQHRRSKQRINRPEETIENTE